MPIGDSSAVLALEVSIITAPMRTSTTDTITITLAAKFLSIVLPV
jgi:hypothetical protein